MEADHDPGSETPRDSIAMARKAYRAFADGDVQAVLDLCDPEIELHDPVEGATYHGHEGLVRYLEEWLESWDECLIEAEEVIPAGDRVVVMVRWVGRGKGSGVEAEMRDAHVWTVRDGKGVRFEAYLDRGDALEAVGFSKKSD